MERYPKIVRTEGFSAMDQLLVILAGVLRKGFKRKSEYLNE